jgi:hypothetical protein
MGGYGSAPSLFCYQAPFGCTLVPFRPLIFSVTFLTTLDVRNVNSAWRPV